VRLFVLGDVHYHPKVWKPWSRWFHDVAWDSTYIIIDRRGQVLRAPTDTD
jgi:hypothetical protein